MAFDGRGSTARLLRLVFEPPLLQAAERAVQALGAASGVALGWWPAAAHLEEQSGGAAAVA